MRNPVMPIGFCLLLLPCLSFAATTNNNPATPAVATQNSLALPATDDPLNMAKSKPTINTTDNDAPDMPDTPDNTNILDGD